VRAAIVFEKRCSGSDYCWDALGLPGTAVVLERHHLTRTATKILPDLPPTPAPIITAMATKGLGVRLSPKRFMSLRE
jgi:hypothetical protein